MQSGVKRQGARITDSPIWQLHKITGVKEKDKIAYHQQPDRGTIGFWSIPGCCVTHYKCCFFFLRLVVDLALDKHFLCICQQVFGPNKTIEKSHQI